MNRRLQDPHQALALPEMLEDALEHGSTNCISFNRKGTLLAAGLEDGRVALWDFETRGVARVMHPHRAVVTGLAWSSGGTLLISAAQDGSVVLWNIKTNTQVGEISTGQPIIRISMNRRNPRLCLVSFSNTAPAQLDFGEERSQTLPFLQMDTEKVAKPASTGSHEGILAVYNKSGSLILMTLAKGFVAVLKADAFRFVDLVKISGNVKAVSVSLSKNGKFLLVNYQDRIVRSLEVVTNSLETRKQFSLPELRHHIGTMKTPSQGSLLTPETPLLVLASHNFQNAVDKNSWHCAAFSSDVEHVSAASANKTSHHIYLWNRWGILERILEGPKNGVRDLAWHPERPLLATVSTTGAIYLWARVYRENWSAFAPDFRELQENEEYVEPEDVFDVNPKSAEAVNPTEKANDMTDVDIDVLTEDPVQLDSSDEDGVTFYHHLPVEIEPQEFDEKGLSRMVSTRKHCRQLIRREEGVNDESAPASSAPDSEPAISDVGADSQKISAQPEGKHRLASSSRADNDANVKSRPAKLKRYVEDMKAQGNQEDSHADVESRPQI